LSEEGSRPLNVGGEVLLKRGPPPIYQLHDTKPMNTKFGIINVRNVWLGSTCFWTLSIVLYSENWKTSFFGNWKRTLMRLDLFPRDPTVGVSRPLPEDENRSGFLNVMFSGNLEFRTMDKAKKPSDSECCTPSSEPFRIEMFGVS
jgi:hypothetical protein